MPPELRRVLIAGGSMAGLLAGILLRRAGWTVEIYERAGEALAGRGAGIATHAELYAAFEQAGITLGGALGVASEGRQIVARDGTVTHRLAMPQIFTSWGLLYRLLRRAFPVEHYHLGVAVVGLAQDAYGVEARLSDGTSVRGDYLLGADGTRSTVRQRAFSGAEPRYAGYTAWRGLADEAALSAGMLETMAGRISFCLPPGEHVLGYLVAGPDDALEPGARWFNWVWYRPADESTGLVDLLTDDAGRLHPLGIPHPLIKARHRARMREDAARLLAPQYAEAIAATAQPFLQPIHEVASERLVAGRVMVIGDAAFTARPHIGLGVSKAAADASTLARALDGPSRGHPEALAAWEDARLRYGRAVLAQSRRLGSYIGRADDGSDGEARHYREPAVVLAEVAAAEPERYLGLGSIRASGGRISNLSPAKPP